MEQAGFEHIRVIPEDKEFFYADAEEWWSVQWTHGQRFFLESLSPEALSAFKAEAFERLHALKQPDGIPHLLPSLFTLATMPQ